MRKAAVSATPVGLVSVRIEGLHAGADDPSAPAVFQGSYFTHALTTSQDSLDLKTSEVCLRETLAKSLPVDLRGLGEGPISQYIFLNISVHVWGKTSEVCLRETLTKSLPVDLRGLVWVKGQQVSTSFPMSQYMFGLGEDLGGLSARDPDEESSSRPPRSG